MGGRERLIAELYADDPERADALVFGRRTGIDRRGFLGGAGLAAMKAAIGAPIVFAASMAGGRLPAAVAQPTERNASPASADPRPRTLDLPGKDGGLILLGDKPLVAETPERLLDDETTPTPKFFIRNNGQM